MFYFLIYFYKPYVTLGVLGSYLQVKLIKTVFITVEKDCSKKITDLVYLRYTCRSHVQTVCGDICKTRPGQVKSKGQSAKTYGWVYSPDTARNQKFQNKIFFLKHQYLHFLIYLSYRIITLHCLSQKITLILLTFFSEVLRTPGAGSGVPYILSTLSQVSSDCDAVIYASVDMNYIFK